MRKGFKTKVIPPSGPPFERRTLDKAPGEGQKIQNRIPFSWRFNESRDPNVGKVTLFNIENKDREKFKKKGELELQVGWLPKGENDQLVIKGTILNMNTEHLSNRATHKTEITFRDTPLEYHTKRVARKWSKGTGAHIVCKNLIEGEIGSTFEVFKPKRKPTYRRGKSFYGPVMYAIKQVVSDLKSKFFFFNKKAYLLPIDRTIPSQVKLGPRDILKGMPTKKKKEKEVTALLNTKIMPSTKIKVTDGTEKAKFRVFSGEHYSRDGRTFHTDITGVLL